MLAIFENYIINYIMSKRAVLLAIHNFSDLKTLAYNAKIRFSLKIYGTSSILVRIHCFFSLFHLYLKHIYFFIFSLCFFYTKTHMLTGLFAMFCLGQINQKPSLIHH